MVAFTTRAREAIGASQALYPEIEWSGDRRSARFAIGDLVYRVAFEDGKVSEVFVEDAMTGESGVIDSDEVKQVLIYEG